MRASGIADDQLVPVRGGEDFQFKGFSLRVIPSMHSKGLGKHNLDSRTIPATIAVPMRLRDYVEGGSLAFLIRLGGQQIMTGGFGMGYIERELERLRPDVAMVGAGPSRLEFYAYTARLMRVLGNPPLVLAQHWDDYRVPFDAPQSRGGRASRILCRRCTRRRRIRESSFQTTSNRSPWVVRNKKEANPPSRLDATRRRPGGPNYYAQDFETSVRALLRTRRGTQAAACAAGKR